MNGVAMNSLVFVCAACLAIVGCAGGSALPPGIAPAALAAQPAGTVRRVIQTFQYELSVNDLSLTESAVSAAATRCGGYLSESSVRHATHWGRWTIRLPVERQQEFLDELPQWGAILSASSTAEDVTSQWTDVEARIAAKKVEESRLLKLLTDATGTLPDVLAVEQHLQRVREEIEQAERRLATLENATTFSTVQLTATEWTTVAWSPTQPLKTQATTVFWQSCLVLMFLVRCAVIALVAVLPWLVTAGVGLTPFWYWRRLRLSRFRQAK